MYNELLTERVSVQGERFCALTRHILIEVHLICEHFNHVQGERCCGCTLDYGGCRRHALSAWLLACWTALACPLTRTSTPVNLLSYVPCDQSFPWPVRLCFPDGHDNFLSLARSASSRLQELLPSSAALSSLTVDLVIGCARHTRGATGASWRWPWHSWGGPRWCSW